MAWLVSAIGKQRSWCHLTFAAVLYGFLTAKNMLFGMTTWPASVVKKIL